MSVVKCKWSFYPFATSAFSIFFHLIIEKFNCKIQLNNWTSVNWIWFQKYTSISYDKLKVIENYFNSLKACNFELELLIEN